MVQIISRGWRNDLAGIASSARRSVLVVAPFIKYEEADWLCGLLRSGVEVITLANIDAAAVSASALDIAALQRLVEASPTSRLVALSNLHAKVFVADEKAAIVTSGNLTRAGLDSNIECGVLIRQPRLARDLRRKMLAFASLGSPMDTLAIGQFLPLETELREMHAQISHSSTPTAMRRFTALMRDAKRKFAAAQVGERSPHAVFADAIQFILERGPQRTTAIQTETQQLMPDLCDDNDYFDIKGEPFGRTWKRRLRHAQLHLKRRGVIAYDSKNRTWRLTRDSRRE